MKKVMVVDAGGRGNALAYMYAKSPQVSEVYVSPGNAGSSIFSKCKQVPVHTKTKISDKETRDRPLIDVIDDILKFASENEIDLIEIGQEKYLSAGIVNKCEKIGIDALGPKIEATILEKSKCWTKDFLKSIDIPVPKYVVFRDADEAKAYVSERYTQNHEEFLVVKADGLAEGKGSYPCHSLENALLAVDDIMVKKVFGESGNKIEVEDGLNGQELMFFAYVDGESDKITPTEAAMDYKRRFDEGDFRIKRHFNGFNPNTGGLGGYSPHPWLDEDLKNKIMDEIAVPTVKNFKKITGIDYKGVIYFGLMITDQDGEKKPHVLEINIRWGDPEAQIILPRLRKDYYELAESIIHGRLKDIKLEWDPTYHVGICAVSGKPIVSVDNPRYPEYRNYPGYPGKHLTNQVIKGLENVDKSCLLFYNGIEYNHERQRLETSGGRVYTLVSRGTTLREARDLAYREMDKLREGRCFNGMDYRRGIGREFEKYLVARESSI